MDLFINNDKIGFLLFCYLITSFLSFEHVFGIRIQTSYKNNKIRHYNLKLTKYPHTRK